MALNQVGARLEGDIFQGMFFWYQAAPLLKTSPDITRVVLEHDDAKGVDDVAVYYKVPGTFDGQIHYLADFFQLKYHVAQSNEYSSDALIDPVFISAQSSLLEHFYEAYIRLSPNHPAFRLHLVSNWRWKREEPLERSIRDSGGMLPEKFFTEGPRSDLGKIREKWKKHLKAKPDEFEKFARKLRFGVNHLGRNGFKEALSDRLALFGLKEIPKDKAQNPYDSLVQQFITNKEHDFTPQTFRAMCERENLFAEKPTPKPKAIGIRSFMRFAERMEDETEKYLCAVEHFDGRFIKDPKLWKSILAPKLKTFLSGAVPRNEEYSALLDCHGTLAFLAGYEFSIKSGMQVFPLQKGPRAQVWKPSGTPSVITWKEKPTKIFDPQVRDFVLSVSVSNDVFKDVEAYIAKSQLKAGAHLHVSPSTGVGNTSISGADDAFTLAEKLRELIRRERQARGGGTAHLFISPPNGLLFFLGQHRDALGAVQLYEFDFFGERDGSYVPSVLVPNDVR
jgi:hypothetical protein